MKRLRQLWPRPMLAVACVVAVSAVCWHSGTAQESVREKDRELYDYLRTVINAGADIFNELKDHEACYRLYDGTLRNIRPLLSHHPELQRAIDVGLAKAARKKSIVDKAFVLRYVFDDVRNGLKKSFTAPPPKTKPKDKKPPTGTKPDGKKKPGDKKKPDTKKPPKTKPKDKKPPTGTKPDDKKKPGDKKKPDTKKPPKTKPGEKKFELAQVSGKVTLNGKPLAKGVVTVHFKSGKTYSTQVANGTFRFKTPLPAKEECRVTVTPAPKDKTPIPVLFQNPVTTPFRGAFQAGPNEINLPLVAAPPKPPQKKDEPKKPAPPKKDKKG